MPACWPACTFHDDVPAPAVSTWPVRSRSSSAAWCPARRLTAHWHGDWNDSSSRQTRLLRERLASSWTVTPGLQTLVQIARALHLVGDAALADTPAGPRGRRAAEFQHLLVQDGVVAGWLATSPQTARANSGSTLPTPAPACATACCP